MWVEFILVEVTRLHITRETDYALRALRALIDGDKKKLDTICKEEQVPKQFGYKIMKKLALSEYVSIVRGKDGGYIINEEILEKSLYDLSEAMENDPDISPCMQASYSCEYRNKKDGCCGVHDKLAALQERIDGELKAVKLNSLLSD